MAFEQNLTSTTYTENDTSLRLTSMEGTKSVRTARLASGAEIEMVISHDSKKRDRHLVSMEIKLPPTASVAAKSVKVHIVIDQPVSPESCDVDAHKLADELCIFVMSNIDALLLGEI